MNPKCHRCEFTPYCHAGTVTVVSNEYENDQPLYKTQEYDYSRRKHPTRYLVQEAVRKAVFFFFENFGICGLGTEPLPAIKIVKDLDNAYWAGICTSVKQRCGWHFGEDFLTPEIITHEYTHAVISLYSKLDKGTVGFCSKNEAGALNESISDIMACAFMFAKENEKWQEHKWIIADRNLSKLPHAFKNAESCDDHDDYGYVHDNSLIPSHAFFLAVQNVGEINLLLIAKIWFRALRRVENPRETFQAFSAKTIEEAGASQKAVLDAWKRVGIN